MTTPFKKPKSLNPLVVYKTQHNLQWKEIAKRTGLGRQELHALSKKEPNAFLTTQLYTALRLKRGLGLDLFVWLEKYFPEKSRS